MKLIKEECEFALKSFEPRTAKEHFKGGFYSFVKAYSILEQLIEEHFELISRYDKLLIENKILLERIKRLEER